MSIEAHNRGEENIPNQEPLHTGHQQLPSNLTPEDIWNLMYEKQHTAYHPEENSEYISDGTPKPKRSIPVLTGLQSWLRDSITVELFHRIPAGDQSGDLVERYEFLRNLRKGFGISSIYYPGVGYDASQLYKAFLPNEIIYLDSSINPLQGKILKGRSVQAGMGHAPFRDRVFDAVFIQDIHAQDSEIEEMLRTLTPDGLVIFSLDDCRGGDGNDFARLNRHPQLTRIDLSYHNPTYRVFKRHEPPTK